MALTRSMQRSYAEAWRRRQHGCRTEGWRGLEDDVEVWMTVFDVAAELDITPWDALLIAVKRRAARVRWTDEMVAAAIAQQKHDELHDLDPDYPPDPARPFVPGEQALTWLAESRNEEKLLTRAAKAAIDAGVAEAIIRRVQMEGRLVTEALVAGLDALDLTADQRMAALDAASTRLLAIDKPTD